MPLGYRKQPVKANISQPTRALDTIYQNTTGRPKLIFVTCACIRGNVSSAEAFAFADVGPASPPSMIVGYGGLRVEDNNPDETYANVVFAVANGYYYRVQKMEIGAGSSVILSTWTEVEL